MKELREYQEKIVNRVISTDKDSIICLPTGAGKTVIASALKEMIEGKVIFVVPRIELIKQASEEFGDVDTIWSDKTSLTGKKFVVASKDSLRSQFNKLPEGFLEEVHNGTMIFDEVHVSIEQTYNLVKTYSPKRVLGLTATPERMDGLALLKGDDRIHKFGCFDNIIQEETVASLIRKGYLAPLKYYAKPIEGITDIKPENKMAEELSGNQMISIFNENNIWGDLVKSYEEYGIGRPALGFTTTIAMADQVVEIFNAAGYKFKTIHGGMTPKERQSLIDDLRDGRINGLVNAALLTYGFDCPPVSYAFNCRHIKSRPLWFQVVGRILRTCEGKENAIFVDHADSISEFSEPDCSLPILDEAIVWRTNGENKEERAKRRQNMRKVQKTMVELQEWDPLPAKLVEITTENTWERLVNLIRRLRTEKMELTSFLEKKEQENYLLQKKAQEAKFEKERVERELSVKARSIEIEKMRIEHENRQRIQELQQENEKIKALKNGIRYEDKDETFNHIRRHYIQYRRYIEEKNPGIDKEKAHEMVIKIFVNDEERLPFLYDKAQLSSSLKWWFRNYETRYCQN